MAKKSKKVKHCFKLVLNFSTDSTPKDCPFRKVEFIVGKNAMNDETRMFLRSSAHVLYWPIQWAEEGWYIPRLDDDQKRMITVLQHFLCGLFGGEKLRWNYTDRNRVMQRVDEWMKCHEDIWDMSQFSYGLKKHRREDQEE